MEHIFTTSIHFEWESIRSINTCPINGQRSLCGRCHIDFACPFMGHVSTANLATAECKSWRGMLQLTISTALNNILKIRVQTRPPETFRLWFSSETHWDSQNVPLDQTWVLQLIHPTVSIHLVVIARNAS